MRKLLRWIVRALHIKLGKEARPIADDPKNRGLKDGYYDGPLDLFGEIT